MIMIITILTFVMPFTCMYISLVLSNDVKEDPDIGLVNFSSINHIITTNEHLYTFV